MTTDIVQINADKISKVTGYTSEEVAIVKDTVAKGTTDKELAYFLSVSKSIGLNPFNKEVWCYKDNKGNLLVFTGRDGYLSKAQSNPAFNGIRSSEVRANDEFEIDIANNKIKHTFGVKDRGNIIGAYAIAFRKDGEPTIEYVEFSTYNKGYNTWKSHPADMIKKVAETKVLKKAFGISGVQSEYDYEVQNGVAVPLQVEEMNNEALEELKILLKEFTNKKELEEKKVPLAHTYEELGVKGARELIKKRLEELK